jgi:hypothetical protein
MRKINESFIASQFNTRLKHKCTAKQTQFTASDYEIFSDLNKLDSGSKQFVFKKRVLNKISINLPQKRKRNTKNHKDLKEKAENDVVMALADLMQPLECESSKSFDKKDSDIKDEGFEVGKCVVPESKVIESGFCRNMASDTIRIFSIQTVEKSGSSIQSVL